jgi:carbon-monoxide dehydrogenase large subunit
MVARLTGTSVQRVEDPRILTGRGRYVDDLQLPGMVHAAFVRSPFPHARITGIDIAAALDVPGVKAVITAHDLARVAADLAPVGPPDLLLPSFPALARDTVRLVGDPVAVVLADSRAEAEDGAEAVEVDYEPLPGVGDMDDVLAGTTEPLFPELSVELGTNVVHRSTHRYGDTDAAFAAAHRVVRARFEQHRHANVPMECRGIVAHHDPATGTLDVHTGHQSPHALRLHLSDLLGVPAHAVRVRCRDIGGSFGQKSGVSREDVAVAGASMLVGRPVKWIEDRSENLMVGGQAREERVDAEAAVDPEGRLLGVRLRLVLDQGAYPQVGFPATGYTSIIRALFPAAYRLGSLDVEAVVVTTNKGTYVPYRGPWEIETWARERLLDVVARELGLDPLVVRERNLLRSGEMPAESVTGVELQGFDPRRTFDDAVALLDVTGFRARQAAARDEGRLLGLGLANVVEPAPVTPSLIRAMGIMAAPRTVQEARARLEPDGTVTVFTSQMPHGQSHETTLAQLAADELGVGMDRVRVVHGDTQLTPFNLVGTGGSRAATLASGAVVGAARAVRERVLDVASQLMEIDPADLELVDGAVVARGAPEIRTPLAEIGRLAHVRPGLADPSGRPGIEEVATFDSAEGTWSVATHACEVEVDPETGLVEIGRYLVVGDCGAVINPAVVDGQVRGGVAQGIGAVLLERSAYDRDGQFLSSTFMDHLLPTSVDIPRIEVHHVHHEPTGGIDYRGVGEGGAIGAPAALTGAIEDALAHLGVRITEQHLPPARILELIDAATDPTESLSTPSTGSDGATT